MRMLLGPRPTELPFQSTLHSWASLEISFPLCSAVERENYWAGPSVVNLSCSVLGEQGVGNCFPALLHVISPCNHLSLRRRRAHRLHLRAGRAHVFEPVYRTTWGCPPARMGREWTCRAPEALCCQLSSRLLPLVLPKLSSIQLGHLEPEASITGWQHQHGDGGGEEERTIEAGPGLGYGLPRSPVMLQVGSLAELGGNLGKG